MAMNADVLKQLMGSLGELDTGSMDSTLNGLVAAKGGGKGGGESEVAYLDGGSSNVGVPGEGDGVSEEEKAKLLEMLSGSLG